MKFTYNDDNRHSSVCSVYTLKPQQGQVSKAHQVSVCEKGKPNPSFENKKVTYLQNHRQQHSCSLFPFVSLCLMVSWSFLYTLKDTLQTHIHPGVCLYPWDTKWRAIKYWYWILWGCLLHWVRPLSNHLFFTRWHNFDL